MDLAIATLPHHFEQREIPLTPSSHREIDEGRGTGGIVGVEDGLDGALTGGCA